MESLIAYSPYGYPIVATEEVVTAYASAKVGINHLGQIEVTYLGSSEMDWDSMRPVTSDKGHSLIDEQGNQCWQTQIVWHKPTPHDDPFAWLPDNNEARRLFLRGEVQEARDWIDAQWVRLRNTATSLGVEAPSFAKNRLLHMQADLAFLEANHE